MGEVERIAAGLTKAQARTLDSLPRVYGQWWKPILALQERGLIQELRRANPKGWSYDRAFWGRTELGEQVNVVARATMDKEQGRG